MRVMIFVDIHARVCSSLTGKSWPVDWLAGWFYNMLFYAEVSLFSNNYIVSTNNCAQLCSLKFSDLILTISEKNPD